MSEAKKKIAVFGPGAIGSAFAFHLSQAGHDVTTVARGKRLQDLQAEGAVVLLDGTRAPITVAAALDPAVAYDLVLVTVLAPQVAALLPALRACAAKRVMFMFNTFDALDPLREAVGAERFCFGFPGGVFASLHDGKLKKAVNRGTTTDDVVWAKVFGEAGIPTAVSHDMHAWLRSHAAMVIPLMSMGVVSAARQAGVSWAEAKQYALALDDGFEIVRALGHRIEPSEVAVLSKLPRLVTTSLLWAMSRTQMSRDLGALGAHEPRMLIDMVAQAAPDQAGTLKAIRP
jgi:2-dehydropantoate 2-reductase